MDFNKYIQGATSVLNVGCGHPGFRHEGLAPLNTLERKVGIDINDERICGWDNSWTILKFFLDKPLPFIDNYFDVVIAFDLVEHLSYGDGWNLIKECERVAKKTFIVFAPEGYIDTIKYQREFVTSPWDVHQSGWYHEWFEKLGYEVEYIPQAHNLGGDIFGAFFAVKTF